MGRRGISGIRMIIAIQLFTTALVLFVGNFAIELGSIHLNRSLGSGALYTYTARLGGFLHLTPTAVAAPPKQGRASIFQIKAAFYKMRLAVLCGGIVAFLAGLALAYSIRNPIRSLIAGVQEVASGNYKALVRLPRQDEFAPLVSAFNQMVDSLNRSQEQLRKVFLAADDGIVSLDPQGRVVLWGGGSKRFFDCEQDEVIGRSFADLFVEGDKRLLAGGLDRAAREDGRWGGEILFRSKGGRRFQGWCVATSLRDEQGRLTGYLLVIRDVTERRLLELQLIQSEKMASVGELAAGVAHEINNPLSGILTNAEFLQEEIPEAEQERHEEIREIIHNSQRISAIVRDLLSFSRQKDAEQYGPVSIAAVLKAALNLTGHQMELDNIIVHRRVPAELPPAYGSHNKIEQVFINILSNARHALNEKYPGSHEDKILDIRALVIEREGRSYVRTRFEDHGTGIPKSLLERVVHPFFTTKEQGRGTGLGMSISYNIIRDHGGVLEIQSEEGKYTSVIVDLPVMEGDGEVDDDAF